jgi:hypothetical protein
MTMVAALRGQYLYGNTCRAVKLEAAWLAWQGQVCAEPPRPDPRNAQLPPVILGSFRGIAYVPEGRKGDEVMPGPKSVRKRWSLQNNGIFNRIMATICV